MEIDATLQEGINALKEGVFNTPLRQIVYIRQCHFNLLPFGRVFFNYETHEKRENGNSDHLQKRKLTQFELIPKLSWKHFLTKLFPQKGMILFCARRLD